MEHLGTDLSILRTLIGCMQTHHKHYLCVSQAKLITLLKKYHDAAMCRRTLNYHLAGLELNGFIARTRRTNRNPDGTITPLASLYKLAPAAYIWLRSLAKQIKAFFSLTGVQYLAHNYLLRRASNSSTAFPAIKKEGKPPPPPLRRPASGITSPAIQSYWPTH